MWKKLLDWLLERLGETSTYVAIFNFLAVIGVIVKPELQTIITNLCLAIDALVLFLLNENKSSVRELADLKESIRLAKGEKDLQRIQNSL